MLKVNGSKIEWEENMTIERLLEKCNFARGVIAVKINGKLYEKGFFNFTKVPDEADVRVMNRVDGG